MGGILGKAPAVVNMSGNAASFVKQSISSNKVVIFSKSYCPYCKTGKQQFQKLNFPFLAIELEDRPDCQEIQDVLGEMTGARSVPRIFIDGKFIGGGSDAEKMFKDGSLQRMLNV